MITSLLPRCCIVNVKDKDPADDERRELSGHTLLCTACSSNVKAGEAQQAQEDQQDDNGTGQAGVTSFPSHSLTSVGDLEARGE